VSIAGDLLQKEMPGYALNFGNLWDKFIAQDVTLQGVTVINIRASLQKRDFVRIVDTRFSARRKAAAELLTRYDPSPYYKPEFDVRKVRKKVG
jgi:hypothetical protein